MDRQPQKNTADHYYMRRAIRLARRANGFTSPNPMVGAIIVKGTRVIAQGYHKKAGLPHAEIDAINKARTSIKGATLYVNLEPCCYFGRTPPCVDEIIKRKFARVVAATKDPNPRVSGRSFKKLSAAGVRVDCGLLADDAQKLNEVFFKNMRHKIPFVVAKVAQSLDGKIATCKGESKWITGTGSRRYARKLRDLYDSVLVGVTTVLKDDPHLNGIKKIPYKIIIDPKLETPSNSNILKENPERVIIFASAAQRRNNKKIPSPARVYFVNEHKGSLSLSQVLKKLYALGIVSVFVEGGSFTLGRFLEAQLIDKVHMFIAPSLIGGKHALSSFGAQGNSCLVNSPSVRDISITHIGADLLITGYPCYATGGRS